MGNPSLKSVFLLSRDGGGDEMLLSSFENLLLEGLNGSLKRSVESLLRPPGRTDGEFVGSCACVIEVRRFSPSLGVPSLLALGAGFSDEFTDVMKICFLQSTITLIKSTGCD